MMTFRTIRDGFAMVVVGLTVAACAPSPALTPPLSGVTQFDAGSDHACALTAGGAVKCWGMNQFGELGSVPLAILGAGDSNLAVAVTGVTAATQVSVGSGFSCALMSGGGVKCWGNGANGQLGNGVALKSNVAVDVVGVVGATQISAGSGNACALVAGGAVKCWGWNFFGELGNGTTTTSSPFGSTIPVDVSGITGATQVSVGGDFSCAVVSGGAIKCWGINLSGQLGNGTTSPNVPPYGSLLPVDVSGITGATQVTAGATHACAVVSGVAKCWGDNQAGALGDGTTTSSNLPVDVSGLGGVSQITAGSLSTCAVVSGGAVKCWGRNDSGQLGNGTNTDSHTPVTVIGLAATSVSADYRACALRPASTVECWGPNHFGQLGNGTNADSNTPVAVLTTP